MAYTEQSFRVGDVVRVVYQRPNDFNFSPSFTEHMLSTLGTLGRVTEVGGSDQYERVRVKFDGDTIWTYKPTWLIPEKKLEGAREKKSFSTFNEFMEAKRK